MNPRASFRFRPHLSLVCCAIGALASLPHLAVAQTCTEDADCAPEEYCDRYPSADDGASSDSGRASEPCAAGEECDLAPAAEVAPPEEPAVGQCERGGRTCQSDDDCLADHYCARDDVSVACPPNTDCGDLEVPESSGRCEHEPYRCSSDADCPEPTVCGRDGECVFELTTCERDDECGARYECLPLGRSGEGSASADDSKDLPVNADSSSMLEPGIGSESHSGGADPAPADGPEAREASQPDSGDPVEDSDPRPIEEDVEPAGDGGEPEAICFPQPSPCEADSDCDGDWVCAPLEDTPPGWDDLERTCLPPGIAAALAGDLDVEGGGGEGWSSSDGQGEIPRGDGEGEPIDDDDPNVDEVLGTQGGSEGSAPNDGCTVAAPSGTAGWRFLGLLASVGVLVSRRRSRAS